MSNFGILSFETYLEKAVDSVNSVNTFISFCFVFTQKTIFEKIETVTIFIFSLRTKCLMVMLVFVIAALKIIFLNNNLHSSDPLSLAQSVSLSRAARCPHAAAAPNVIARRQQA